MSIGIFLISMWSILWVHQRFVVFDKQMKVQEQKKSVMGLYGALKCLVVFSMIVLNMALVLILETAAMMIGIYGISRIVYVLIILVIEILISTIRNRNEKKLGGGNEGGFDELFKIQKEACAVWDFGSYEYKFNWLFKCWLVRNFHSHG